MTTKINTKRLILFDIDGTLLHPGGVGRASTREAMLEVFGTAADIASHHFAGKTDWYTLPQLLFARIAHRPYLDNKITAYTIILSLNHYLDNNNDKVVVILMNYLLFGYFVLY